MTEDKLPHTWRKPSQEELRMKTSQMKTVPLFKTSRRSFQIQHRHPSTPPQRRSSLRCPNPENQIRWAGTGAMCQMLPGPSSRHHPRAPTKGAHQTGEERKTPRSTTVMNKAALFTGLGIHICFVLFSMTTGCKQRSHREEH